MATMRDVDPSLPASAQVDSRIQQLMEMGFDEKISERALRRCKPAGDFNAALDMLQEGTVPEEDEFDVMFGADGNASAPKPKPAAAKPAKPTGPDVWREQTPAGAGVDALLDERVTALMEMGFNESDAVVRARPRARGEGEGGGRARDTRREDAARSPPPPRVRTRAESAGVLQGRLQLGGQLPHAGGLRGAIGVRRSRFAMARKPKSLAAAGLGHLQAG